jgi:hypothetical protein
MHIRSVLTAALFCLSTVAAAHSELPHEQWCTDGVPTEVGSFELAPSGLVRDREDGRDQCPTGNRMAKDCGQFMDDYEDVGDRAKSMCAGLSGRGRGTGDMGSTIPVVRWPATYLDPAHHRLYRSEHGLRGICVRCEARRLPAGPEPKR